MFKENVTPPTHTQKMYASTAYVHWPVEQIGAMYYAMFIRNLCDISKIGFASRLAFLFFFFFVVVIFSADDFKHAVISFF